jgi:excinuclease ABC subunit A
VLDMTVEDAHEFFKAVPPIRDKMAMLEEVGLGYVKVGQQATTLSGGEAQRVKLAKELSRRATGQTLYILDEPTTGLHFEDVRKLLEVLHALVDQGNSVVVIEHNLEVIKTADWVIDLGPEGGDKGGEIVAEGTPEQVAGEARSYTGHYLRSLLEGHSPEVVEAPKAKARRSSSMRQREAAE